MLLYLDKTDSLSSTRRKKVTHTVIHLSTSECYTGTWSADNVVKEHCRRFGEYWESCVFFSIAYVKTLPHAGHCVEVAWHLQSNNSRGGWWIPSGSWALQDIFLTHPNSAGRNYSMAGFYKFSSEEQHLCRILFNNLFFHFLSCIIILDSISGIKYRGCTL